MNLYNGELTGTPSDEEVSSTQEPLNERLENLAKTAKNVWERIRNVLKRDDGLARLLAAGFGEIADIISSRDLLHELIIHGATQTMSLEDVIIYRIIRILNNTNYNTLSPTSLRQDDVTKLGKKLAAATSGWDQSERMSTLEIAKQVSEQYMFRLCCINLEELLYGGMNYDTEYLKINERVCNRAGAEMLRKLNRLETSEWMGVAEKQDLQTVGAYIRFMELHDGPANVWTDINRTRDDEEGQIEQRIDEASNLTENLEELKQITMEVLDQLTDALAKEDEIDVSTINEYSLLVKNILDTGLYLNSGVYNIANESNVHELICRKITRMLKNIKYNDWALLPLTPETITKLSENLASKELIMDESFDMSNGEKARNASIEFIFNLCCASCVGPLFNEIDETDDEIIIGEHVYSNVAADMLRKLQRLNNTGGLDSADKDDIKKVCAYIRFMELQRLGD